VEKPGPRREMGSHSTNELVQNEAGPLMSPSRTGALIGWTDVHNNPAKLEYLTGSLSQRLLPPDDPITTSCGVVTGLETAFLKSNRVNHARKEKRKQVL